VGRRPEPSSVSCSVEEHTLAERSNLARPYICRLSSLRRLTGLQLAPGSRHSAGPLLRQRIAAQATREAEPVRSMLTAHTAQPGLQLLTAPLREDGAKGGQQPLRSAIGGQSCVSVANIRRSRSERLLSAFHSSHPRLARRVIDDLFLAARDARDPRLGAARRHVLTMRRTPISLAGYPCARSSRHSCRSVVFAPHSTARADRAGNGQS